MGRRFVAAWRDDVERKASRTPRVRVAPRQLQKWRYKANWAAGIIQADDAAHPERKQRKALGNPQGAAHMRSFAHGKGAVALKAEADERAERLRSTIEGLRANGITSAYAIAKALNAEGITTPRKGRWDARRVINLLQRLGRTL
jgi:hypothetical protein